ncbi:MAG: hypothetical protein N2378_11380 [Chloroflexaceae bacterium]|nr:hypothetical protein [Chloroflexaceae bacterium]
MRYLRRVASDGEEMMAARPRWCRALLRYAWLWFLAGVVLVAALPPRPASAQNPLCDVSNLLGKWGLYWLQTRTVVVEGHELELRFCAPREHSIVAEQMLDLAVRALPVLDALTDVRLDGSHQRTFFLEDTQKLLVLNADGFIDSRNDAITLHPGSLESTVIHELAHYWSDRQRFPERWMVEAYAEYLTSLAAPQLAVFFKPLLQKRACEGLPLQDWKPSWGPADVCPYAVGLQVFEELAAAAGPDTLRRVIGDLSRQRGGVRSEALLTYLERESGANLSPLMRGRVFGPELDDRLEERAKLQDRRIQATSAAAAVGIPMPPVVAEHLNAWRHQEAAAALEWIEPVLHEVSVTHERCVALQLDCAALWRDLPPDPGRWMALRERLREAPQILSVYGNLRDAAEALGLEMPAAFSDEAARLNFAALRGLQAAEETLTLARTTEERCVAVQAPCPATWRQSWNKGDTLAARGVLEALGALLNAAAQLEARCEGLEFPCGALWRQALAREGLEAAKTALDVLANLLDTYARLEPGCKRLGLPCAAVVRQALEQEGPEAAKTALAGLQDIIERGTALEDRCGDLGVTCASLWREAIKQGDIAAGRQVLGELETLLDEAVRVEQACAEAGWSCAKAWRDRLANAGLREAREVLSAQERALPVLAETERGLASSFFARISALIATEGDSPRAADPLAEAKRLFEEGKVEEAQELANAVKREYDQRERQWLIGVALLIAVIVAGLGALLLFRLRRRAAAPAKGAP